MIRPKGYAQIFDPEAPLFERDTASCCHCGKVIFVKPGTVCTTYLIQQPDFSWKEEPGASCFRCAAPVCLECYDLGVCTPLERMLEEMEGRSAPRGRIII